MSELNQPLFKIHAGEILQKSFTKSWGRGLDAEEVNHFLHQIANEWQELTKTHEILMERNRSLERQLDDSERELRRLKSMEDNLLSVLKDCQQNRQQILDGAKVEAEAMIKKSEAELRENEAKAKEIVSEAKSRAKNILEETELMCRKKIAAMHHQLQNMQQEYQQLNKHSRHVVEDLQFTLSGFQDRVSRLAIHQNNTVLMPASSPLDEPEGLFPKKSATPPPHAKPTAAKSSTTPSQSTSGVPPSGMPPSGVPPKPSLEQLKAETQTPSSNKDAFSTGEYTDHYKPKNLLEEIQYKKYLEEKKKGSL